MNITQASAVPQELSLESRVVSTCNFILILQSNAELTRDGKLPPVLSPSTDNPNCLVAAKVKRSR